MTTKYKLFRLYHNRWNAVRQAYRCAKEMRRHKPPRFSLLLAEGHAIGALVHGRIGFVSANLDLVQRAVIFGFTVICALLDGASDALVCVAIHNRFLLPLGFGISMACWGKNIHFLRVKFIDKAVVFVYMYTCHIMTKYP